MKIYASKSNTLRPLDEYIGQDVWVKAEYHDYGRSKGYDRYYVRVVGEESNSYGDFYLCNFYRNTSLLLPITCTQEHYDRIMNRVMRFKKTRLVPAKPLRILTTDELFEVED